VKQKRLHENIHQPENLFHLAGGMAFGLFACYSLALQQNALANIKLSTPLVDRDVVSGMAWKIYQQTPEGKPTSAIFWTANIPTAALFGLGNWLATSLLIPLTSLIIPRAIVLNGFVGVACE
jgi:hypothetical protein